MDLLRRQRFKLFVAERRWNLLRLYSIIRLMVRRWRIRRILLRIVRIVHISIRMGHVMISILLRLRIGRVVRINRLLRIAFLLTYILMLDYLLLLLWDVPLIDNLSVDYLSSLLRWHFRMGGRYSLAGRLCDRISGRCVLSWNGRIYRWYCLNTFLPCCWGCIGCCIWLTIVLGALLLGTTTGLTILYLCKLLASCGFWLCYW